MISDVQIQDDLIDLTVATGAAYYVGSSVNRCTITPPPGRSLVNTYTARLLTEVHASAANVVVNGDDYALSNYTATGNQLTGEDNLCFVTLKANALPRSSSGTMRITAWGRTANNANAKTIKLKVDTQTILTTSLTTGQVGQWRINAMMIMTGIDTQDWVAEIREINTGALTVTTVLDMENGTATLNDSDALTVKCTGEATGTDDIVQEGLVVELI